MKPILIFILCLFPISLVSKSFNVYEPYKMELLSSNADWEEIGNVQVYEATGRYAGTYKNSTSHEGKFIGNGTLYVKSISGFGRVLRILYKGNYYSLNRIAGKGFLHLYKNDGSDYGKHIVTVHYFFTFGEDILYIPFNPNQR